METIHHTHTHTHKRIQAKNLKVFTVDLPICKLMFLLPRQKIVINTK